MTRTAEEIDAQLARLGLIPRADGTMPQAKFDSGLVQGVCQFIDDTGIVEQIAAWRAEDQADRKPGGRPAIYNDRQMLVLTQLLLRCGEAPQIVEIARTIGHRLTADSRERLGLPPTNGRASEVAIYHRVRGALDRCTSVFDPAPGRASSPRPLRTTVEAIKAARDPQESQSKRARAHWVANQLLEGTLRLVPDDVLGRWRGNLTLDATVVPIFGGGSPTKSPKPDDSMSPEFDGGYHQNHDGSKTWGYDLHIALMGQNHYDADPDFPLLAAGISLDEPSRRVAENAIACLSSIRDRGHPADLLITDMGYFANQKAEKFHLPARALGYGLVGDYKKGQTGVQATHKGVITVDGGRYCVSMPEPLITATADYREGRITKAVYAKRIAQRANHRFRAKDGVAHSCPAQGSGATASCPLRPAANPLSIAGRAQDPHPDPQPTQRPGPVLHQHRLRLAAYRVRRQVRPGAPVRQPRVGADVSAAALDDGGLQWVRQGGQARGPRRHDEPTPSRLREQPARRRDDRRGHEPAQDRRVLQGPGGRTVHRRIRRPRVRPGGTRSRPTGPTRTRHRARCPAPPSPDPTHSPARPPALSPARKPVETPRRTDPGPVTGHLRSRDAPEQHKSRHLRVEEGGSLCASGFHKRSASVLQESRLVELRGFEPLTFSLRRLARPQPRRPATCTSVKSVWRLPVAQLRGCARGARLLRPADSRRRPDSQPSCAAPVGVRGGRRPSRSDALRP